MIPKFAQLVVVGMTSGYFLWVVLGDYKVFGLDRISTSFYEGCILIALAIVSTRKED